MIRRLLLAAMLWAVGATAAGQVIYREGPLGGQRFYAGPQGVAGGCYVGPGGQMVCGPGGCGPQGGAQTVPAPAWQPARPFAPPSAAPIPPSGQGMIPQTQGRVRAGTPSPVVVRVESRRGPVTIKGTGTLVAWRAGRGLVLTVAHVLKAGYRVVVRLADGREIDGRVVAADAQHDAALVEIDVPKVQVIHQADAVPQGGAASWAGYGQDAWAVTAGQVAGTDGDFLVVQGKGREGDSGSPIYTPQGAMIGMLSESSQGPGEPWRSEGPRIEWISGFVALHWDKTEQAADPPPQTQQQQVSQPLPNGEPRVDEDHGQRQLLAEVAALRKAIAALELKAGPPGPVGPPGPPGKDADPAAVAELRAAVAALQARVEEPITFHLRAEDGTIIESSEVRLGESQDLFLIPQRRSP